MKNSKSEKVFKMPRFVYGLLSQIGKYTILYAYT